jgi:hypothetical protein
MIENIKARFAAKKFNIWTEEIDPERKSNTFISGYWLVGDEVWYGHPLYIFFKSSQKRWIKKDYR